MSDLVSCPRCGRMHPRGYRCNAGQIRYIYPEKKIRSRKAWTDKSIQIREDANYLCEVCRDHGVYTYADVSVHHIEKLKDRPDLWLDDDNLICLCRTHHQEADEGKLSKSYLHDLASKRMSRE